MKTCSKCSETKPMDDFHRDKSKKDGRRARCAECAKADKRASYADDPDKFKERVGEYREANPEKVKEMNRKWREANDRRPYNVAYYEDNKEMFIAYCAEYRQTDAWYWSHRKSVWRSLGILDVDTLDWEELIESQDGKCYVCGKIVDVYTAQRDHDHETGMTRAAVCSTKCNVAMDKVGEHA